MLCWWYGGGGWEWVMFLFCCWRWICSWFAIAVYLSMSEKRALTESFIYVPLSCGCSEALDAFTYGRYRSSEQDLWLFFSVLCRNFPDWTSFFRLVAGLSSIPLISLLVVFRKVNSDWGVPSVGLLLFLVLVILLSCYEYCSDQSRAGFGDSRLKYWYMPTRSVVNRTAVHVQHVYQKMSQLKPQACPLIKLTPKPLQQHTVTYQAPKCTILI